MKLRIKDIKIVGEGSQVKEKIIEKYGDVETYIKLYVEEHGNTINEITVKNYLNSKTIISKSFKLRLMYDLNIDFERDIVSEEKQISNYIDRISANIVNYENNEDIKLFKYLESLCLKKRCCNLLGKIYKTQSVFYSNRSEIKCSIKYLKMAIESERDSTLLMQYYSDLGLTYYFEKELDTAIDCYKNADLVLKKYKVIDSKATHLHYYRMGLLLSDEGNTERARNVLEKSLNIADQAVEKGLCLMNIGLTYKRDCNCRVALSYYHRALKIFKSVSDYGKMAVVYNNIAELFRIKGMYKRAFRYITASMSYWDYLNGSSKAITVHTYYQISLILGSNINFDKLIEVLNNVDGKCKYKRIIIEMLETIFNYGKIRNIGMLYQVKSIINDYLHRSILDMFKKQVMEIYGAISLYIEDNERGVS